MSISTSLTQVSPNPNSSVRGQTIAARVFTNGESFNPEGIGTREIRLQSLKLANGCTVTLVNDPKDQRLYLKFGLKENGQTGSKVTGVTYYRLSAEQRLMPQGSKVSLAEWLMAAEPRLVSTPLPETSTSGHTQQANPVKKTNASQGREAEQWFNSGTVLTVAHKRGASRIIIYKQKEGDLTYWGVNNPVSGSVTRIFTSNSNSPTAQVRNAVNGQIVSLYQSFYGVPNALPKRQLTEPPKGDDLMNNAVTRFVSNFFGDVAKSLTTHFDALKEAIGRGDWASVNAKSATLLREFANSPLYLVQQGVRTINGLVWPDQTASIQSRVQTELINTGDTIRFGCALQFDISTNVRRAAKQGTNKIAPELLSGEAGLGAGIRTSAEISVVKVKGGTYSVNVELKDVGGATASANAKAPFWKSNESDNLSASAGAFAGLGNLSRGRYQCASAEDAIRVTKLLHRFVKDRNSLTNEEWRFLNSKRVAHSEGGYYSVSASASLQVGFSLWPRGANTTVSPAVKPSIVKFQAAGGGSLSIQGGYDAIFIDGTNGQPAKVRLRNEMQFQSTDFSAGLVNPRTSGNSNPADGGLPKQPRISAKVTAGGRSEFGSRLVIFETEYTLTKEEARYYRSLGGKIPLEEITALQSRRAVDGSVPNFARVRITNIRRQDNSPYNNTYERGSITVSVAKPSHRELVDLQFASVVGLTQGTKAMQALKPSGDLPQRAEIARVRETIERKNPADVFVQGSAGTADVNGWGLTGILRNSSDQIKMREEF